MLKNGKSGVWKMTKEECEKLDIITINKIPVKHIKELRTYDC